jgi:hypothetical protein
MNYEDEPYVRMYTRKTLTSRLLGWEGRAVQQAMLNGEFDAAGIFAIEGDAAECISVVTELPLEIVRVGLDRLVKTKTWVVTGKTITWPTYEEAQNCMRSDRLRQRASRKARAERSVTDVTPSRQPVTDVTSGHAESRAVTLPPSAPSHPPILPPSPEDEETSSPVRRLGWFVPADWTPKPTHQVRCQELRLDIDALSRAFRLQEFNRQYSDWDRRFGSWIEAERLKRETAAGKSVPGLRGVGPPRHGSRQGNAGMTGFEGLEKTT